MERAKPITMRTQPPGEGAPIADLVMAAREGREDAIGQLVTEFSPMLWHVARAAGLSSGDAEDVVQTIWLRLLAQLHSIHTPAALAAWLVTAARREAWRVRSARRRQVPSDENWLAAIPDPGPSAEEMAVAGDERREIWVAFRRLSRRCQELLRIVAFVPRPAYDVIAADLGMRVGSIGPTRGRCLAKLRALLTQRMEEAPR